MEPNRSQPEEIKFEMTLHGSKLLVDRAGFRYWQFLQAQGYKTRALHLGKSLYFACELSGRVYPLRFATIYLDKLCSTKEVKRFEKFVERQERKEARLRERERKAAERQAKKVIKMMVRKEFTARQAVKIKEKLKNIPPEILRMVWNENTKLTPDSLTKVNEVIAAGEAERRRKSNELMQRADKLLNSNHFDRLIASVG